MPEYRPGNIRKRLALAALLLGAGFIATAPLASADARSRSKPDRSATEDDRSFRWSAPMHAGQRLEVRGINGNVTVVAAAGSEASVRARKTARRSDPDEVEIRVRETPGGIRVCAHYPRPDGSMNEDCGSQQTGRNDVNVEFRVEVPADVEVKAETVNGGIEALGLHADAEIVTVNGNITAKTRGAVSGSTVNGNLDVVVGRMPASGGLEFRTVNGSIWLKIAGDLDANLRATTTNGAIRCGLELSDVTRQSRRSLRGTLGRGGPLLDVETVNGSIRLVGD
jgi:DUF4097 and DUF4098 domain-containing protein YvlB